MHKRGTELPQSKLTESDVNLIRELIDYRESLKREIKTMRNSDIAEKFNVHVRTIDRVSSGYTWSHL